MKYIASCSFGKDSLAAILTRLQRGEPVDGIVYCRIMFDRETSAELPEHEEWIYRCAIPTLQDRYGLKTTIVQAQDTYIDYFYRQFESGENIGKLYGWPYMLGSWCNSRLKVRPMQAWRRALGEYKSVVGIAADETARISRARDKGQILPLADYDITEAQCFEICREAGLLSPAYNRGRKRLGCWFCHKQCTVELRRLRREHPELWDKLMVLDRVSPVSFKPERTLEDFDETFKFEDRQMTLEDCFL